MIIFRKLHVRGGEVHASALDDEGTLFEVIKRRGGEWMKKSSKGRTPTDAEKKEALVEWLVAHRKAFGETMNLDGMELAIDIMANPATIQVAEGNGARRPIARNEIDGALAAIASLPE